MMRMNIPASQVTAEDYMPNDMPSDPEFLKILDGYIRYSNDCGKRTDRSAVGEVVRKRVSFSADTWPPCTSRLRNEELGNQPLSQGWIGEKE